MMEKNLQISSYIKNIVMICSIAALAVFAYWGIQHHQFLNFDDDVYVQTNHYIFTGLSLENIKWAFSFNGEFYWHPITWLSLMLDSQIFGLKAGPMLVENLLFHILNAILLYLILLKITGARFKAGMVALLFAVHPCNVESVAWLVERKAVLSGFFFMLGLYLFLFYIKSKSPWFYGLTLGIYVLGVMAKPIIIIFPLVLLILDYWPLKRFKPSDRHILKRHISADKKIRLLLRSESAWIIYEKIPFAVISCLSVLVSMFSVQQHKIVVSYQVVPLFLRIKNYFVSILQYLYNAIWPLEISIFHPFPTHVPIGYFLAALFLFVLFTVFTVLMRRKRPWFLIGWLWFLVTLMPAGGLVQAGLWPAYAHRFMYLPLIGFFIMLVWEGDERLKGKYSVFLKATLCLSLIVYFAMITILQNTYYSNSYALFHRALQVDRDNPIALNNIGVALSTLGREDDAIPYFKRGMELYPKRAGYYMNYAVCMVAKGDDGMAIENLLKSIKLDPRMYGAYLNLGLIQSRRGYDDEAVTLIKQAMAIRPGDLGIRNNFGKVLVKKGNYAEALDQFRYIVKRNPDNLEYRMNLAIAYQDAGKLDEAMKEYVYLDQTIKKNKGYIYYSMASVYSMQQKYEECAKYLDLAHKDSFDSREMIKSDKRFENFRNTGLYESFLKKVKVPLS